VRALEKPLDLLLLLVDEGAEVVDRPPRVLGRDPAAIAVGAGLQAASRFAGFQKSSGVLAIVDGDRLLRNRGVIKKRPFAGNFGWAGQDSNLRPWD
jgi:hypothetical protein